jgi:glycolate oxidase FAD binding subunit
MLLTGLSAELAGIVGGDYVTATAPAVLPPGWSAPLGVVAPGDAAQVAETVRAVEAANAAMVVVGGGTQLQTGYPPRADRPTILLSTARMNRITDFQPEDLTATCEPGVTLAQLQSTLAVHRQEVALDVPLPERATLSGIVATGRTGFNRPVYGAPRDLVIGLRAVMSGGVEVKGGGKVVKNVAGYDICKLFTGAWGTMGVITELTLKLRTRPELDRMLAWDAPNLAVAARVGLQLHHARLAGVSFLATNELNGQPHLVVGLQGTPSRVEWQSAEYARLAVVGGLTTAPTLLTPEQIDGWRDRQARLDPDMVWAAQIVCLPTQVADLLAQLAALPHPAACTAHCATGIVSLAAIGPEVSEPPPVQPLSQLLPREANLTWTRLNGDDTSLHDVDLWGRPRAEFAWHRALKQALDPKATFSPGRFYGRL